VGDCCIIAGGSPQVAVGPGGAGRAARDAAAAWRVHDGRCYGPRMARSDTGRWRAALEGFTEESFEADGKRRTTFRGGSGPAVIVISEMPGITPGVAEFGRKVRAAGCTMVMPSLFGHPGRPPSGAYLFQSIGPACVSREFSSLALKRTSPITVWLRKLAAAEHERCGGPGVGVVGMCFTGGFALAMMVDDIVLAPVLSQPSLPFPVSKKHKADIGISDADLSRVKRRTSDGACLLGLRFSNDPFCFEDRFATLKRELGDAFIAVEIDSSPGNPHGHPKNAHSVLTEHLQDREGTPSRAALDQTLTFFREKLGVGTGPGPEA
jgi:dienelactone hydrolase